MTDEGERPTDGRDRGDRVGRRRRSDERDERTRSEEQRERSRSDGPRDPTSNQWTQDDRGGAGETAGERGPNEEASAEGDGAAAASTRADRRATPSGAGEGEPDPAPSDRDPASAAADAVTTRVGAYLLDFTLLSIVSVLTFAAVFVVGIVLGGLLFAGTTRAAGEPSAALVNVVLLGVLGVSWFLVGVLVFAYFTLLDPRGGTLGKRALDLAVVEADGSPVSTRSSALRTAVMLAPLPVMAAVHMFLALLDVDTFGFLLALGLMAGWLLLEAAVMTVSDTGQRLGDRLAGTYVVAE